MDKTQEMKEKLNKLNTNEVWGRILLLFTLILLTFISSVLVIEIKRVEKHKLQDSELFEIYKENINNKEILEKHNIRGLLKIPKIGINELIYIRRPHKYDIKPSLVLCQQFDDFSSENNNTSLIQGHDDGLRTKDVFALIEQLEIGDYFIIEFDSRQSRYKIVDRFILNTNIENILEKDKDKNRLYLSTFYPFPINNKNLILESEKVSINEIE